MAETTSFGCANCAYFLTEENGEDVCMCAASPFVGKERDPSNGCDYFLAGGGGDIEGVQKAWDAYISLLIKAVNDKEKELQRLREEHSESGKETCLNCQHCNKGFFTNQGMCVCKESPSWQHMRMGKDITPCKFFEAINVGKE